MTSTEGGASPKKSFMNFRVDRIISVATLLASVAAIILVLKKPAPAPAIAPQPRQRSSGRRSRRPPVRSPGRWPSTAPTPIPRHRISQGWPCRRHQRIWTAGSPRKVHTSQRLLARRLPSERFPLPSPSS